MSVARFFLLKRCITIVGAGLITFFLRLAWPDLIVGLGIALMNADAARKIYTMARSEYRTAFL